ncbi:hypothetical protein [Novosphingobium album (ex Liu et al. 2023)]|uniref:WD40 repeat domain-containing protein n=1 Tax=Novosphingobium album (ex Liu et al. 2023) TaxID=3031130 RepID=A0ABT5WLH8_9SPHN|nr:hypothetical protein [Novosphingobium album (ex Liu et al. 2023)]MDE8650901.1 hypothetical protein [Novosphingobium album (ex Liu et al. 2023)]
MDRHVQGGRTGRRLGLCLAGAGLIAAGIPALAKAPDAVMLYALPERTLAAEEARQGVASDGAHIYAIDNSRITRYALDSGARVAEFSGDPHAFPHINSCTVAAAELVCAASNYPAVPQTGTVEFFDAASLRHLRSVALPANPGSFTALIRRDGRWWASFAQYDGKGGVPGKDHRDTLIAELDGNFAVTRRWTLPASVLARIAPRSVSGLGWGADGRLYASGHDKPEVYVLEVPAHGTVLRHVATIATATFGQAIDFDPAQPGLLWSIDRQSRTVVASRIPPIPAPKD